jgi:hypothetical protein
MELRVSRLPLALDPLIAEAKRRARQRRVLLLALAFVLGTGGTMLALRPFGLYRTARSTHVRFEPGVLFTGSGGGPPPVTGPGISAVSASSHGDAWVVGSVAWHWDGRSWRTLPLPTGEADIWSVADVAPDDAWVVGARGDGSLTRSHALIEHWNGARWSVVNLPRLGASFLYGVSAFGPRSAWAAGATYGARRAGRFVANRTRPLLLHWDGVSWRKWRLPSGRRPVTLDKVIADGPSSVWVVSTGQEDSAPGFSSLIEHWNGTRWQEVPPPFGRSDPLASFGATGWDDAWAVGSYGEGGNAVAKYSHALAAHWNGHSWRLTHVPSRSGDNDAALEDVAVLRPDDAWAMGESQHLQFEGDNGLSATGPAVLFEHWNGRNWQLTTGAAPPVYDGRPALTGAADGSAWAIGTCFYDNFIVRWKGGAWVFAKHPQDRHWRLPGRRPRRLPSCSSPAASR